MSDRLTASGLQSSAGLFGQCGVYEFDLNGSIFNPQDLNPYLLFDAETSMIGTLENPTLDLDPSKQETLDVITATRAGNATFVNISGEIETAQANTVRVDHSLGYPAILVEPSAINLVTYSEDFSNSLYTKRNSTVTSGFSSPDGENNAFKLTATANEGDVYFVLGGGGGTTKAVSVFAKAASATSELIIQELGYTGRSTKFNLNSGAITFSNSAGTSTIENVGNGWFRCTHIETYSSGQNTLAYAYRSTTVDSLYLFGAQVETGSVATSYIPTSGSTVTRNADDLKITGSAFSGFFNASEGTTYVETVPKSNANTPHYFEYFNSSNAASNRMGVYTPVNGFNYFIAGVTNQSMGAVNLNQVNRIAVSYKVNDLLGSLNGASELAVTSAALPTGIDTLRIANAASISASYNASINGHIKRLIVWPLHSDSL